jgi:hypothetical protein
MASSSKIEIEKFNGENFNPWMLKMEYLLVDRDQWVMMNLGTANTGTSTNEWKNLDRKAKSTI